jgi:hypothetical protein
VRTSGCRGVRRSPGYASGVDEPSTAEGPVLPSGFLEADHHILGVRAGIRQARHELRYAIPGRYRK